MRYRPRRWRRGLRRFAPLAAGIMLLAFLGMEGERIDIGAHVAGFAVGCALGAVVVAVGQPAPSRRLSLVSAAIAFAVFAGAWVIALAQAG